MLGLSCPQRRKVWNSWQKIMFKNPMRLHPSILKRRTRNGRNTLSTQLDRATLKEHQDAKFPLPKYFVRIKSSPPTTKTLFRSCMHPMKSRIIHSNPSDHPARQQISRSCLNQFSLNRSCLNQSCLNQPCLNPSCLNQPCLCPDFPNPSQMTVITTMYNPLCVACPHREYVLMDNQRLHLPKKKVLARLD
jgi:hypothetical protein